MSSELSEIFKCVECGECCKGYGGTYVTDEDIRRIAEYIDANPDTFAAKYCQMSGSRPVLALGTDGYCVFWKNKLCSIHPVKPRMCKAWPYIENVLKDVENWRIMAGSCPGIRPDMPEDVILDRVRLEIEKRKTGS